MEHNKWSVSDLTSTALMAALVFVGTYIFKIPIATGYVHLGDCMILLTVAIFGTRKGAIAGAIGAGLADLAGGFAYWVLPTILIKCMWAFVAGAVMYKLMKGKFAGFLTGSVSGGILQVAAYTLVGVFLYGARAAILDIPALTVKTLAAVILGAVIYKALEKSGAAAKIRALASRA